MKDSPIFDQMQLEFTTLGKFCGLVVGPPRAPKIIVDGAPELINIEVPKPPKLVVELADTIVMSPLEIQNLGIPEIPEVEVPDEFQKIEEVHPHVFSIKKSRPHKKNGAISSLGWFSRAA